MASPDLLRSRGFFLNFQREEIDRGPAFETIDHRLFAGFAAFGPGRVSGRRKPGILAPAGYLPFSNFLGGPFFLWLPMKPQKTGDLSV